MTLSAGTRLGAYEILGSLGAGGMGEVYRARDSKLKRDVAIKILPEEFSRDAERLMRFQREAEVVAQLKQARMVGAGHPRQYERIQYSVSPDGQRFLMNTMTEVPASSIHLIMNWKARPQ